jgi:hypothetical protein
MTSTGKMRLLRPLADRQDRRRATATSYVKSVRSRRKDTATQPILSNTLLAIVQDRGGQVARLIAIAGQCLRLPRRK